MVGASGQVGGALFEALLNRGHEAVGTYRSCFIERGVRLDLGNSEAVDGVISDAKPDWVFCPAGLTQVDLCEEGPAESWQANFEGPLRLARAARRLGTLFVYYSSEYVFDGSAGPYGEDDSPHPLSHYGRSKWAAEAALREIGGRCLIIRTTVVYGPERQRKNFAYQVLRKGLARDTMRVPRDQVSTPTYNEDLAEATLDLAEGGAEGLFHIVGPDRLDRYAFALAICDTFGLDPDFLEPLPTPAMGQRAPRPLRGGLRAEKVRGKVTTALRGIADGLQAMRDRIGDNPDGSPSRIVGTAQRP